MLYEKDKNHRITLRLNDAQFAFLAQSSEVIGVTPSEFLRIVINTTLTSAMNGSLEKATNQAILAIAKEEERRENETSDKHDIV